MKKKLPTATATEFSTPGLPRRVAAMVYDTLLLMAISILYGAIVTGLNVLITGAPETGARIAWGNFGVVVFIGWILTLVWFFCYFWTKSGQTLGMKTWRMKVFDEHTMDLPSLPQCVIRCCCAPFSLLLLGAGYWTMYLRKDRQTLHDAISKTRVLLLEKEHK